MVCLVGGIILVITGILAYIFPNLIAGYNTLTKEQKKGVNVKRLKAVVGISLFVYGLLLVITYFILYSINKVDTGDIIFPATILPFTIILMIIANLKKVKEL